jgi:hypothetical protein
MSRHNKTNIVRFQDLYNYNIWKKHIPKGVRYNFFAGHRNKNVWALF